METNQLLNFRDSGASKPLNSCDSSDSTPQLLNFIKAIAVVGEELAISWDDGSEQYLSLKIVRQHCPCAHCVGEPDVMGKRDPFQNNSPSEKPESFLLKSYQFVGGYALQFFWMDGHSSGIYSYQYLRKLGDADK